MPRPRRLPPGRWPAPHGFPCARRAPRRRAARSPPARLRPTPRRRRPSARVPAPWRRVRELIADPGGLGVPAALGLGLHFRGFEGEPRSASAPARAIRSQRPDRSAASPRAQPPAAPVDLRLALGARELDLLLPLFELAQLELASAGASTPASAGAALTPRRRRALRARPLDAPPERGPRAFAVRSVAAEPRAAPARARAAIAPLRRGRGEPSCSPRSRSARTRRLRPRARGSRPARRRRALHAQRRRKSLRVDLARLLRAPRLVGLTAGAHSSASSRASVPPHALYSAASAASASSCVRPCPAARARPRRGARRAPPAAAPPLRRARVRLRLRVRGGSLRPRRAPRGRSPLRPRRALPARRHPGSPRDRPASPAARERFVGLGVGARSSARAGPPIPDGRAPLRPPALFGFLLVCCAVARACSARRARGRARPPAVPPLRPARVGFGFECAGGRLFGLDAGLPGHRLFRRGAASRAAAPRPPHRPPAWLAARGALPRPRASARASRLRAAPSFLPTRSTSAATAASASCFVCSAAARACSASLMPACSSDSSRPSVSASTARSPSSPWRAACSAASRACSTAPLAGGRLPRLRCQLALPRRGPARAGGQQVFRFAANAGKLDVSAWRAFVSPRRARPAPRRAVSL